MSGLLQKTLADLFCTTSLGSGMSPVTAFSSLWRHPCLLQGGSLCQPSVLVLPSGAHPVPVCSLPGPSSGSQALFLQLLLMRPRFQSSPQVSPSSVIYQSHRSPLKIRANNCMPSAGRSNGPLVPRGWGSLLLIMRHKHSCSFQLYVTCIKLVELLRPSDPLPACACQARVPVPFPVPLSLV